MTQEQFKTAVKLHNRLEALLEVQKQVVNTKTHCLWYAFDRSSSCGNTDWKLVDESKIRDISDILDRHEKMIRQEIDDEIANIIKQIEEL